jgi:hypothetical protein
LAVPKGKNKYIVIREEHISSMGRGEEKKTQLKSSSSLDDPSAASSFSVASIDPRYAATFSSARRVHLYRGHTAAPYFISLSSVEPLNSRRKQKRKKILQV